MLKLKSLNLVESKIDLSLLPTNKLLINTINAYSYNMAQKDSLFANSLQNGGALIPDGAGIVKGVKWILKKPIERIAGWDLFVYEMAELNKKGGKCFFMGSSETVLSLIKKRASIDYPNIHIESYSPPYKNVFSKDENTYIISLINAFNPDLLWIGMTAPKQEKWAYTNWEKLEIHCHVGTIGAVFDFYAGTIKRAPQWMQTNSLEWGYRLLKEPKRMWKRYIIGNAKFLCYMLKERMELIKFHL